MKFRDEVQRCLVTGGSFPRESLEKSEKFPYDRRNLFKSLNEPILTDFFSLQIPERLVDD